MNLAIQQIQTIKNIFDTDSAAGHAVSLMRIYHGFLMSSNEYLGELSSRELEEAHYTILQVVALLSALSPLAHELRGGELC